MTITDLIMELENIQDEIDIDADPDVFIQIGGQSVLLTGVTYKPETKLLNEAIVLE